MNIYLVRHGESQGNIDKTVHGRMADHAIPLSEEGLKQAARAGEFLKTFLFENRFDAALHKVKQVRLWTSPYERTRQTAKQITEVCGSYIKDVRENVLLCEQQFGLFDGIPDEDLPIRYPEEYAHYAKCEEFGGRFWARMPLGESRFDVATRVHQAFGTFHRDAEKHGIKNIIVVCHGVTMRAFLMQWLHLTPEWFDAEKNPKNCSIILINRGVDRGYVYEGE